MFDKVRDLHDDMISETLVDTIEKADDLWRSFSEKADKGTSLEQWVYGSIRFRLRFKAINKHNLRVKRRRDFHDEGEEISDGVYAKPTSVCFPEQENVVFYKQMLEHCGMLPADERAVVHLILDRATAEEMVNELGLSHGELLYRRARAMKSLKAMEGIT